MPGPNVIEDITDEEPPDNIDNEVRENVNVDNIHEDHDARNDIDDDV